MKINLGFLFNKGFKLINRPALRNCNISSSAKVGAGSNCIEVKMGRYSYMGKNNSVANTDIGSFCSIASYCAIGGGAHVLDKTSTSPVFYKGKNIFGKNLLELEPAKNRKVSIGNDVWIGEAVFINEGITIGDGAIIGAHSVVTHDVPPYAIVAGAPAKLIRYRFDEEKIKRLLEIKWWEWPDEKIRLNADFFNTCSLSEGDKE